MILANSVSNRPGAWQGPAGAAKSPGRDGAATRSPSGALNVRDGCPWAGQRALQGETIHYSLFLGVFNFY